MKSVGLGLMLVFATVYAEASDLEALSRDGYGVVVQTRVDGEFEGCDFDKQIQMQNGLVFVCSGYSYTYSYMPEVLILKHITSGDTKVLIKNHEFRGKLYKR